MQTRQELTCEFSSRASRFQQYFHPYICSNKFFRLYRPITAEESLRGSCSSVQTPRSSERGRTGIKRDENKRLPDSFMQLHWDQGQQAYRTLKGSCYSGCRCEVCDTFCHIMWRLLKIRARVYRLPGGLIRVEGTPRVCGREITSFPELSPVTVILKSTLGWRVGGSHLRKFWPTCSGWQQASC